MNIIKCPKCWLDLIGEEYSTHECKDVIDYRFEENILWMSDGENWYPRKLRTSPTTFQQPDKTTDDPTESDYMKPFL